MNKPGNLAEREGPLSEVECPEKAENCWSAAIDCIKNLARSKIGSLLLITALSALLACSPKQKENVINQKGRQTVLRKKSESTEFTNPLDKIFSDFRVFKPRFSPENNKTIIYFLDIHTNAELHLKVLKAIGKIVNQNKGAPIPFVIENWPFGASSLSEVIKIFKENPPLDGSKDIRIEPYLVAQTLSKLPSDQKYERTVRAVKKGEIDAALASIVIYGDQIIPIGNVSIQRYREDEKDVKGYKTLHSKLKFNIATCSNKSSLNLNKVLSKILVKPSNLTREELLCYCSWVKNDFPLIKRALNNRIEIAARREAGIALQQSAPLILMTSGAGHAQKAFREFEGTSSLNHYFVLPKIVQPKLEIDPNTLECSKLSRIINGYSEFQKHSNICSDRN